MHTLHELIEEARNYGDVEGALAQAEFSSPHYFRKTLSKTDDLEVVLVCFADKQSTSVHDHGGSKCVVRVLKGLVHEQTYMVAHSGDLVPNTHGKFGEGDIHSVDPHWFHEVTNLAKEGTVLLNFYSPPLPPLE